MGTYLPTSALQPRFGLSPPVHEDNEEFPYKAPFVRRIKFASN
jgi:hypothetical protein